MFCNSSLLASLSNLFGTTAETPISETEFARESKAALRDVHGMTEQAAATLVNGLADDDLIVLLHLINTGTSPDAARQKINSNDIEVLEMKMIESPSQHMRK